MLWGIFTGGFSHNFASTGSSAVLGTTIDSDLHLWHGFNLSLLLSIVTVAGGIVFYFRRNIGRIIDNFVMRNEM